MLEVIARLGQLPSDKQDAIAALIMEELASEERWDEQFAKHPDVLSKLADEALLEYKSGMTKPLDDLLK